MDPEELRGKLKKGVTVALFFALALALYGLRWRGLLVAYLLLVVLVAILAILIQSGRGGGLASSLGGLGGDSLLGVHSASPIAKATYVMLSLFLFIIMLLARMGVPAQEGGILETHGRPGRSAPTVKAPSPAGPAQEPSQATPGGQPSERPPAPEQPATSKGAGAPATTSSEQTHKTTEEEQ